jgi:hypothetical protein
MIFKEFFMKKTFKLFEIITIAAVIGILIAACNADTGYTTLKVSNNYSQEFIVQANIGSHNFADITLFPGDTKTFQIEKEFYPDGKINYNVAAIVSEDRTSNRAGLVIGGETAEVIFTYADFNEE